MQGLSTAFPGPRAGLGGLYLPRHLQESRGPRASCYPALAFVRRLVPSGPGPVPQKQGTMARRGQTSRPTAAGEETPPGSRGPGVPGHRVLEPGSALARRRRRGELPRTQRPSSSDRDQAARRRRLAGRRREPPWAWRRSAAPRAPATTGCACPPTTPRSVRLRGRPRPARAFLQTPPQPLAASRPSAPTSRPGSHSRRPSRCRICRRSGAQCSAPGLERPGRPRPPAPGPHVRGRKERAPGGSSSPQAPLTAAAAAAPTSTQLRSCGPWPTCSRSAVPHTEELCGRRVRKAEM